MAQRIVFTDSGFWKYSWAHLVMSMTESCRWVMQCRLRAWRPRASNKGLRPHPLRTEISPVSLNLLMMLCSVDDEICKAFVIWHWGTLFLKYSRCVCVCVCVCGVWATHGVIRVRLKYEVEAGPDLIPSRSGVRTWEALGYTVISMLK